MNSLKIQAIELIVEESGYKILRLTEGEDQYSWWIIETFIPATVNSSEPVEYHTVTGIEMTDFINTNHDSQNKSMYLERLEKFVENANTMTCEFHKDILWKKYVSRYKKKSKS